MSGASSVFSRDLLYKRGLFTEHMEQQHRLSGHVGVFHDSWSPVKSIVTAVNPSKLQL